MSVYLKGNLVDFAVVSKILFVQVGMRLVLKCSAVQCSAVQCSAVQCSTMQCGAVQKLGSTWSTAGLYFLAVRRTSSTCLLSNRKLTSSSIQHYTFRVHVISLPKAASPSNPPTFPIPPTGHQLCCTVLHTFLYSHSPIASYNIFKAQGSQQHGFR